MNPSGTVTVLQAALIAGWVALAEMWIGYTFLTDMINLATLMSGLVIGLIMGNVPQAIIISAAMQLVYMGIMAPGGQMPTLPIIGAAVAIPISLTTGMSPAQAITIAVPVSILGQYLMSLRYTINSFIVHLTDRAAERLDDRRITFFTLVLPSIMSAVLFFPVIFVAVHFGAPLVSSVLDVIPQSVLHALDVVGGSLPALGFALTLSVIGRPDLLPFYLLAYFFGTMFKPLNVNTLTYAIIGGIIAYLYVVIQHKNVFSSTSGSEPVTNDDSEHLESESPDQGKDLELLTPQDVRSVWRRWWWSAEMPHSFERMQAPAFLWGLMPALRKLYGKNENELREAYKRHLVFFNTEGIWGGGPIVGITLSLEEQRARALAKGETPPDPAIINNVKVSLMGPLAGIGDSIDWATLMYLLIAIALPWAQQGSVFGPLFPFLALPIITYAIGYYLCMMGYRLGGESVSVLLGGEKLKAVIDGLSTLGYFMMGILTSAYVSISSTLKWTISGKEFALQGILDNILPGILPLATVLLVYWYFRRRGLKVLQAFGWMLLIFFILGIVGIL